MVLHVVLKGRGPQGARAVGLCGSEVTALYFSKVPGNRSGGAHLCSACRSLALQVAATGQEVACSVGATHS